MSLTIPTRSLTARVNTNRSCVFRISRLSPFLFSIVYHFHMPLHPSHSLRARIAINTGMVVYCHRLIRRNLTVPLTMTTNIKDTYNNSLNWERFQS
jgi:hypothetical protein